MKLKIKAAKDHVSKRPFYYKHEIEEGKLVYTLYGRFVDSSFARDYTPITDLILDRKIGVFYSIECLKETVKHVSTKRVFLDYDAEVIDLDNKHLESE